MKKSFIFALGFVFLLSSCPGPSTSDSTSSDSSSVAPVTTYALTVDADAGVSGVTILNDGVTMDEDSLAAIEGGSELTARVALLDHKDLVSVSLDEEVLTANGGTKDYEFVMPEANATLTVVTSDTNYPITIDNDDAKGTVKLFEVDDGNETLKEDMDYVYGEAMRLEVVANSGFEISSVTINDSPVTLVDNSYSFDAEFTAINVSVEYITLVQFDFTLANAMGAFSNATEITLTINNEVVLDATKALGQQSYDVRNYSDEIHDGSTVEIKMYDSMAKFNNRYLSHLIYVNDVYVPLTSDNLVDCDADYPDGGDNDAYIVHSFVVSGKTDVFVTEQPQVSSVGTTTTYPTVTTDEYVTVYGLQEGLAFSSMLVVTLRTSHPDYVIDRVATTSGSSQRLQGFSDGDGYVQVNPDWMTGTFPDLTVTGEVKVFSDIVYEGVEPSQLVDQYGEEFVTRAYEGQSFYYSSVSTNVEGKYIQSIEITSTAEGFNAYVSTNSYYGGFDIQFTMPSAPVTIKVTLADCPTITINEEHLESYMLKSSSYIGSDDVVSPSPGQNVYLFMLPEAGYLITRVQDDNNVDNYWESNSLSSTLDNSTGYTYYYINFTVSRDGSDMSFTITCGQAFTAEFAENSNITVSSYDSGEGAYAVGANVTMNFTTSALQRATSASADGHPELEVSLENRYTNNYSVSFVMPAYDVSIVVVVEDLPKVEVTLNVSGTQGVDYTQFQIMNSGSEMTAVTNSNYESGMKVGVLEGTSFQVLIQVVSGKEAVVSYKTSSSVDAVTVNPDSVSNGEYRFNRIAVSKDMTELNIAFQDATPVTITINDKTGDNVQLSYYKNNTAVENLNSVFVGDYFDVKVTTPNPDGFVYMVNVTDASGNAVSYNSYNGGYAANGNMTVTITKAAAYTIDINVDPSFGQYDCYVTLSDNNYTSYNDGDTIYAGTKLSFAVNYYGSGTIDVVVTVGDETIINEKDIDRLSAMDSSYQYIYYEINGNVVVTITPHVDTEA